jgi:hypothetical protein
MWHATVIADRVVAPELCFVVHQARLSGVSFALAEDLSDWIAVA